MITNHTLMRSAVSGLHRSRRYLPSKLAKPWERLLLQEVFSCSEMLFLHGGRTQHGLGLKKKDTE